VTGFSTTLTTRGRRTGGARRNDSDSKQAARIARRNATVLDLRGLRCPHPVLRAKKALRGMAAGDALVLECTDPLTVIDMPHFCNQTGHVLSTQERVGELYIFTIVKKG
jgi:tRNA 2-thiouridine synthesizing protein A